MSKKLLFSVSLTFLVVLSGCWSRTELNDLSIVTALAIDKKEEKYKVTAQVLNVSELAGDTQSGRVAVSSYVMEGESVFEALRKLTKLSPKKLYLAHLRIVVLGEALAKEGIEKSLAFLSRDHEVRTDFYIVVSKEKDAECILNILTPIDKIPASKIFNSIKVSEEAWAPTRGVNLDTLIANLNAKGKDPVLTGVFVKGDPNAGGKIENVQTVPSPTMIELDHLAAFKGDKLVGWLNQNESKGYNYITNNVNNTVGVVECKGGNITVEVLGSKTDKKVMVKGRKPKIVISVEAELSIGEVQCEEKVVDEEKIKQLEEKLEQHTIELLEGSITKAKGLKADIFGFGEEIHKKDPKLWKELQEDWNEKGFVDLEVVVQTFLNIRRTGIIQESFKVGN